MSLLILSGFEPNGMAGLLADDRLAESLSVARMAIATGQTAQTATELRLATPADPELLNQQLASLGASPTVVKIGLIFNRETACLLADWFATLPLRPTVVLDPVNLSSSDQQRFSDEPLLERIRPLLPWVSVLTPNADECQLLTSQSDPAKALQILKDRAEFNGALLVSGGHGVSPTDAWVVDLLQTDTAAVPWCFRQTRLASSLRGSGCRLSTAIACALTEGYNLIDACTLGSAVLHRYWRLAPQSTAPGWPDSLMDYPDVAHFGSGSTPEQSFPSLDWPAGLYPVVDSAQWVRRLADTGVRTLQLRIKNAPEGVLRQEIAEAVRIAHAHQLQLFINDHWSLAIELGAYGVHLGQEDLHTADLDAIAQAGLRLGISTHGDAELMRAHRLRPSYLAVGAVFPTQTKDMSGQIQGLARLRRYVRLCKGIPVVAIGGITPDNLADVLDTHVTMVAVVSAVTGAAKPELQSRLLNERILHRLNQ